MAAALLVAGCSGSTADAGGGNDATAGEVLVVVSTTIWGDVVGTLVGTAGTVDVLLEPGADPHASSASAAQAQRMREADLVVVNGLGLEEGLLDAVASVQGDGTEVLELAESLDPLPAGAHGSDGGDHAETASPGDDAHVEGLLDPHVWMDPLRVADAVRLIGARLADVAPNAAAWEERADGLAADIEAVHEEVAAILEDVPDERRQLVTNHDALAYFADRYGFEVIGTVVPSTSSLAESSAAALEELAALVRERDVPAIFTETTGSASLAEAVAAEVGRDVAVVPLHTDSLAAPGAGPDRYVDLIRTDARLIADALR